MKVCIQIEVFDIIIIKRSTHKDVATVQLPLKRPLSFNLKPRSLSAF